MNITQLGTVLIKDIDDAYDKAVQNRNQQIHSAVNDFVKEFTDNSLSLYGVANIDAIKNYEQIPTSVKMPSLMKIGYLSHKKGKSLAIPAIPAIINLQDSLGINVCYSKSSEVQGCAIIQNIALRYILSLPDNLLDISILDSTSNGSNYGHLLALSKVKANLYTTEQAIITKLNEITENFTKLQMEKLTFKYQTIEEFNNANDNKIPYKLMIVNNYPDAFLFRREGLNTLKRVLELGKKFGVCVLMTSDIDLLNNQQIGFKDDISNKIGRIEIEGDKLVRHSGIKELVAFDENYQLLLDNEHLSKALGVITYLNDRHIAFEKAQNELERNKYSFEEFYKAAKTELWTKSSIDCLSIPLGFPINYKPKDAQYATIHFGMQTDEKGNKEGNYHALIGGETGSGKSVLINNLIINACYYYSPEELQLFVIDMKGNEYPEYFKLPHIKVLFQDASKIEVGLNVLEYVRKMYEHRVQLFRKEKVNEFDQYRNLHKLPRILCVIDEFQTFNQSENGEVKRKSSEIIDLLVGKGRAYGIHMILASQSLANVNLNDASETNINVRLALRLDEKASRQILSSGNNETLKFPDLQLVYNNKKGYEKQDNKVIKLPFLKGNLVKQHIDVFNQNLTDVININKKKYLLPGETEISIYNNERILKLLKSDNNDSNYLYFGEPYLIKEDDSYYFFSQETENNLLMIGQDYKTAYRLLFLFIIQFKNSKSNKKVHYVNYLNKANQYYNTFDKLQGDCFEIITSDNAELFFDKILDEINTRKSQDIIGSELLIVLPQLNNETSLNTRMSPMMTKLKTILETGPNVGIYSILYVDSYNSLSDINSLNNLCKFKIALLGGDSSRIMPNRATVDEEGFVYFQSPQPFIGGNPEYVIVYNSFETNNQILNDNYKGIIMTLFSSID